MKHICYLFLICLFVNCSISKQLGNTQKANSTISKPERTLPKDKLYIDKDHNDIYVEAVDSVAVQQTLSDKVFRDNVIREIKYPALAREKGTEGIAQCQLFINEEGKLTDIIIVKSVSPEIDAEIIRALNANVKDGFSSLIIEGKAVKYKKQYSIGFWLD